MLLPQDQRRKNELLTKLQHKSINRREAQELKEMLERERNKASLLGDLVTVIIIGILLAAIISIIFGETGQETED